MEKIHLPPCTKVVLAAGQDMASDGSFDQTQSGSNEKFISRINSGKLLKAATLQNIKEWVKEKRPDKKEQEWLEKQIKNRKE